MAKLTYEEEITALLVIDPYLIGKAIVDVDAFDRP